MIACHLIDSIQLSSIDCIHLTLFNCLHSIDIIELPALNFLHSITCIQLETVITSGMKAEREEIENINVSKLL